MQTQLAHQPTTRSLRTFDFRTTTLALSALLVIVGCSTIWIVDESPFHAIQLAGPIFRVGETNPASLGILALCGLALGAQVVLPRRIAWWLWCGLGIVISWFAVMGAGQICSSNTFHSSCQMLLMPFKVLPPIASFLAIMSSWMALRPAGSWDRLLWVGRILSISLLASAVVNLTMFVDLMEAPLIEMPIRWLGAGMPLIIAGSLLMSIVEWSKLLWPKWGGKQPTAG